MPSEAIPPVTTVDPAQWQPHEYDLIYHFANFGRMANAVITEPGPLQGWFSEALWRHYSYAPFNARVMENYYSLAFFYGYDAPWNIYYRHPGVLERLELALNYTFALMGDNGAIPEYATADLDTPMLAPSSFGMEYLAAALEVAGEVLPAALRERLVAQARKAALYVLTSDESWEHARSYTNQFLGAMAGGAQLARLTGDPELTARVVAAGDALLNDFASPMGFLYENDGPETFAYFFVTLHRLVPLYKEWRDPRVLEVLHRHCDWMARWMLPEPDGEAVTLAASHQTRTAGGSLRLHSRRDVGMGHLHATRHQRPRIQKGMGYLLDGASDRGNPLKLFLMTREEEQDYRRAWRESAGPSLVAELQANSLVEGYSPVSTLSLYPPYAPAADELAAARDRLPCLDPSPRAETMEDDRGNQYSFFRLPGYYAAFAYSRHRSVANHGPALLWLPEAGTLILAQNGDGPSWETVLGDPGALTSRGTGKAQTVARVREGRGGHELQLDYADLGVRKTYVVRPEGIDVQISSTTGAGGVALHERIPLLLRGDDIVHLDYGRCPAAGMGSREFGFVTRTLGVERGGHTLLTLDLGEPVSAVIRPAYEPSKGDAGQVRAELIFAPAARFFRRTGYRLRIDGR